MANDHGVEDTAAGKVWFITGAGRGFGRVWARAALDRGDRVVATVRRLATLDDLAEEYGDALLPLRLDVTDREAVFAAVRRAHDHFGRLDVVVSNAGYGMMGAIEEADFDAAHANFETNVFGTLSVVQAVLPILRAQGGGHIIGVSSVAGVVAVPTAGIYEGAKFAVEGMFEALAGEVAGFGIKVTLVEPGTYATDFLDGSSLAESPRMPEYDDARAALAAAAAPDTVGDPEATAAAILRLVDAEQPPLRLILGILLPLVKRTYAQRIATWDEWADVSAAAHRGDAETASTTGTPS